MRESLGFPRVVWNFATFLPKVCLASAVGYGWPVNSLLRHLGCAVLVILAGVVVVPASVSAGDGASVAKPAAVRTPLENVRALIARNKASLAIAKAELSRRERVCKLAGTSGVPRSQFIALRRYADAQVKLIETINQQIARYELQALRFELVK